MSSAIRVVDSTDNNVIACRVAAIQEVTVDGQWYVYYTVGADLGPHLDKYAQAGWTVHDPEMTGLYSVGLPIHRRKIVKRDKGPSPEQALADADGENDFPRLEANKPVCYSRQVDGRTWLVYSHGPHMRAALDELWKAGKAVSHIEILCTEEDEKGRQYPLLYQGKRCYRRLIVPKDKGLNPGTLT